MTGLLLSLRADVTLVEHADDGPATLDGPWGRISLEQPTPGLLAALRLLAGPGATEAALGDLVLASDGVAALATMTYHLRRLGARGLLCYTVLLAGPAGDRLCTVVPMTSDFRLDPEPAGAGARFRLSRFACCRRDGDALVLESPLSFARAILPGQTGAALVAELVGPRSSTELCERVAGLTPETALAFLGLLASAGLIGAVDEAGLLPEDRDAALAQWEFHDLLFHARSRRGRHDAPVGGTYRFLDTIPPLPAHRPPPSAETIPLDRPDLDRLMREDQTFSAVLERRRSIRTYGETPLDARQLGELLYRTARTRRTLDADPSRGRHQHLSDRPYPSGGAVYDLELYLTINACADLPAGLYHYDPAAHQLGRISGRTPGVEALLRDARMAAGLADDPPVLLTLASRFQRVSWKYSSIAYALTLKHVGVLTQTISLVATAMGLATCILGAGDADLFARAAGTHYFEETSVGEIVLGTMRAPAAR